MVNVSFYHIHHDDNTNMRKQKEQIEREKEPKSSGRSLNISQRVYIVSAVIFLFWNFIYICAHAIFG